MTLEIWIAFVAAVSVFCLIPGPTVILVIGQAMTYGKQSVIPLVLGVLAGDFVAMSLSLLGLGAILATSSELFLLLKWFGVGYLVYLGIKSFLAKTEPDDADTPKIQASGFSLFKDAFLVTALNPKDIVFFVAFLPQFINTELAILPQTFILMVTFLAIVAANITFYTLFAGRLREYIQTQSAKKWFNRVGGSALIGAGGITAMMEK